MQLLSNFSLESLLQAVIIVVVIMFAATIHEIAHGYAAYLCGDTTAKDQGRLSLNPLAHIDPFGSVVLPLIMVLLGGPVFAFAKPVPFNPNNLRHRERDELLVALAGPASNLAQAFVAACLIGLVCNTPIWTLYNGFANGALDVLTQYLYVNLVLCFFNLIPLPPLDGSHVVGCFLRGEALEKYYQIQRYAMPVLLILLYIVPTVLNIDPISQYLRATAGNLYNALLVWPARVL
jgi:Zn-dependent protease